MCPVDASDAANRRRSSCGEPDLLGTFASHTDRYQNIGTGKIGRSAAAWNFEWSDAKVFSYAFSSFKVTGQDRPVDLLRARLQPDPRDLRKQHASRWRTEDPRQLLLNFNYLEAKLAATDTNALIADYDYLADEEELTHCGFPITEDWIPDQTAMAFRGFGTPSYRSSDRWLHCRRSGALPRSTLQVDGRICFGNPMNLGMSIAVYATISKQLGLPLRFPGTEKAYRALSQVTSAEILAKATIWAGQSSAANDEDQFDAWLKTLTSIGPRHDDSLPAHSKLVWAIEAPSAVSIHALPSISSRFRKRENNSDQLSLTL
jgi:hypothetical protein